jgi:predicted class III extradiol MEMO1 family dioxygenase
MYEDAAVFERALAARRAAPPVKHRVTGITVPHHLAAADLIALGFRCASRGNYERIILLSPDHFKRSRLPFVTTRGVFETVFGDVSCDDVAFSRCWPRVIRSQSRSFCEGAWYSSRSSLRGQVLPGGENRRGQRSG